MQTLLLSDFDVLLNKVIKGEQNAISILMINIKENQITQKFVMYLADKIEQFCQQYLASDANLLFLQAVLSIYENGYLHPDTLNRLKLARGLGHIGALTLFAYLYANYDFTACFEKGSSKKAKQFNKQCTRNAYNSLNCDSRTSLIQEAINNGNTAAMILASCELSRYLKHYIKKANMILKNSEMWLKPVISYLMMQY